MCPTAILTFSWYTLFSQTRKWRPSHSGITVSPGMEEMPSLNKPVQRLKVATLPLPWARNPFREILTTGNSRGMKLEPVLNKLLEYMRNWIQHVNRMPRDRLSRLMKHYYPNWQKESWQTSEETSRYVRPERVNMWPNPMTDIWWWWWWWWW